ncbi:MAG: hypothetical protein ACREJ5_24420, partial [Geminicoccaceae bacterium]
MRTSAPFCVIDRPFVVWSDDVDRDNKSFLESVDSFFYIRAVREFIGADGDEALENELDEDQARKDVSSLARMLWHHGAETLVMLLGPALYSSVRHRLVLIEAVQGGGDDGHDGTGRWPGAARPSR